MHANIIHHGALHGVTGFAISSSSTTPTVCLIDCGLPSRPRPPDGGSASDRLRSLPVDAVRALVATHVQYRSRGADPVVAGGFGADLLQRAFSGCCRW